MSDGRRGLYRLGGAALIASGVLFLVRHLFDLMGGPPPSEGVAILAWVASGKFALEMAVEVLFFAGMALIPGTLALHESLVRTDRAKAGTGCGILAAAIPLLLMIDIVQGRLVYPVYGIRITSPAVAEFAVALFHGGLHAVDIMFGVATIVLSLAMLRGGYGTGIAFLGFATGALDIVGAYPSAIGPALTLVCQLFFSTWFVAVGAKLYGMHPAGTS